MIDGVEEDPREKLERLRKRKRLKELRDKAGITAPAEPMQGTARTIIDDEPMVGAGVLSAMPLGLRSGMTAAAARPSAPAAKVPPPSMQNWPAEGDRAVSGYNAVKEAGVRGDLAGRVLGSAGNSVIGGLDFLSEPGRWADDAIGAVAPWWPSLVWDDQGFRLETAGSMSEEEKGYGGVGRIPMSEAKDDAKKFADMGGEAIGFLAPGGAVNKVAKGVGAGAKAIPGVANMVASVTPKGADAAARLGRWGQRMLSTVPEAGAQAFTFGASTADQSIIDEDGSVIVGEDPVQKGLEFASNPLNYLAPAVLSGIYRGAIGIKSGGKTITPQAVQRQVAPYMVSPKDAAVAALGDLPIPAGIGAKDADRALAILHKSLSGGGVPDDVMAAAVKKYNELPGDRPAPAVFLRSELSAYPKAVQNLDDALYEIGQKSSEVGDALRTMRTTQADRLNQGLQDTLGKGTRVKRDTALKKKMRVLGEQEYQPIIERGAVDDEAATTLKALLNDKEFWDQIPKGYKAKLSMDAIDMSPEVPSGGLPANPRQSAGPRENTGPDLVGGYPMREKVALQQRIEENPLEVAHNLYSSLGKRIRNRKDPDGKLQELQDAIRDPLFKAGGKEYEAVNSKYRNTAKARRALASPDKLFAQSLSTHKVAEVKDAYKAMSAAEKESYKVSLKGLLEDELRRAKANNDFVQLGRMKREGALDAIEEILDVGASKKGSDTVRLIRDILDEQDTILAIDPATKTNRNDRLASGREAYAGKTGALEHTGRYDLNALGQDIAMSGAANLLLPGSSAVVPIRAIYRGAQKLLAAGATPNRGVRSSAARIALERPTTQGAPKLSAARQAARDRYRKATTINGRFVKKPEILDPETPGAAPFDDEAYARSMSDDGKPKLDTVDDTTELTIIDEGYTPQSESPKPKALPGGPKLLASDAQPRGKKDEPEVPKSAAERYVDELRARKKELEGKLDEQAAEKDAARGSRREDERVARDAERLRAEEEALKAQTASEGLKIERERERALAAQERARRAAEWVEEADTQGPPNNGEGPFHKLGRMEDRAMAPAGDPRSLREVMGYLVGEGERAAVSNNLRRFGRDSNLEWYNAPEINRANEILRAAQGQKKDVSPEVLQMVGKLNKANREWLVKQLEDPQGFDLIDIMQQIDNLPAKGPKELQRAAEGPIIAGFAGIGTAVLGGKALYDAREKRTPEQVDADRRKLYGDENTDDLFEMPAETDIRKMQASLNAMGYRDRYGNKLDPDGKMGDRFREAVAAFAQANGLQPHALNPGGLSNNIMKKLREYEQ